MKISNLFPKRIANRFFAPKFPFENTKINEVYYDQTYHNYARVKYEDGTRVEYCASPYGCSVEITKPNGEITNFDADNIQVGLSHCITDRMVAKTVLRSIKRNK